MTSEHEAADLFSTDRLVARALAPGHEALLQHVFQQAGDFFVPITGRPEPDPDAAAREIRSSAATPGRAVALLVLRDTGEPVGALGWWEGSPEPEVTLVGMLLIAREERGRGLAREALAGLERWSAGRGIRRLRTGVSAHAAPTHSLLRALGFRPLDQRTHISIDRGRMMIALFEKELAPAEGPDGG